MSTQEKRKKPTRTRLSSRLPRLSRQWVALPLRGAAAFALARGIVLGECSPFALGMIAASGPGAGGLAALAGAAAGYLTGMGLVGALRYIAAGMLIFSVAFAFYDIRLYQAPWFMGLSCTLVVAVTGFVYLSAGGWSMNRALYLCSEALLAGVSCRMYQTLALEKPEQRRSGLICLTATLLASGAGVALPRVGSLATVLAAALILVAAHRGSGAGASWGALLGLVLAASGAGSAALAGALALGGLLAGWEGLPRGRLWQALAGLGAGFVSLLWLGGAVEEGLALTAGAALYLALPEQALTLAEKVYGEGPAPKAPAAILPERVQESARYRLEEQAAAFRSLYQQLKGSMAQNPTGESTNVIFERASRRVCKGCPQWESCWKREPLSTWDDLNAALAAMQEKGSGSAGDYPERFRRKCRSFSAFCSAANEELFAFWTRRQYRMRLRESRAAVCRQYDQLARLLEEAAASMGDELRFEAIGSAAAGRAIARLGVRGEAGLWLDHRGRRVLMVTGREVEPLKTTAGLRAIRSALGTPVELWDSVPVREGTRLTFRQAPPYSAAVGVAVRKKAGQTVSGDNGSWFKDEGGSLWVTVCDGMGSGPAAGAESGLVLHLVEDFLHAHIEPEAALTTLTSALALRGEVDGGFTTVDLLHLDLFTGTGELYKLGGAPSYLRRRGAVSRVTGASLPAGLEVEGKGRPDVTRFRLTGGDCAVLLSDGVTDGVGDHWLRLLVERWDGGSPKRLAEEILQSPQTRTSDDCTVAVVRLVG